MNHLDLAINEEERTIEMVDNVIAEIDPLLEPMELNLWQGARARAIARQATLFARKEGL